MEDCKKNNINKERYNNQYAHEINYKYKTNTRYQWHLLQLLLKEIDTKQISSILDVGCGPGYNTALMAKKYSKDCCVKGIDLSDIGINFAKEKFGHINNLEFECQDVTIAKQNSMKYDLVTIMEVLEHIEDWKAVLNDVLGVSNKYIIISAPIGRMREYEKSHGHFRNFKKGEIETFVTSHGFKIVKTYYAGFPFWSPITRDLLNLVPHNQSNIQGDHIGAVGKTISLTLLFLYKYLSFRDKGDAFFGLFERVE